MSNQQKIETPQQMGISRDESHMGNDRPQVLESWGSVLVDKHMETLEGLMKNYEARQKANETIEQRWRRYRDLVNEEQQLEMYRQLMETTKALLDKESHPKLGENKNTSPEINKTEREEEDRHLEKGNPLKRALKSLENTQPLMCQK